MTPEIEKVLAEATPRPWPDDINIQFPSMPIDGDLGAERAANERLCVITANSYEADQERMRVLTETVEAIHQLASKPPNGQESVYSRRQRNDINDLAIAAITALSKAKAVKP